MGSWATSAAYLTGIGWFFAACIILGIVAGRAADSATGLEPLFTIVGIALGLAAALVGGFRMLMRFLERFGNGTTGDGPA